LCGLFLAFLYFAEPATTLATLLLRGGCIFLALRLSIGPNMKGTKFLQVTSWAEKGKKADLKPGRWVQLGGPTPWNYVRTGLWSGRWEWTGTFPWIWWKPGNTPFSNWKTEFIEQSRVKWPEEFYKAMFGQRIIVAQDSDKPTTTPARPKSD